jgi:hypothetical protein
MERAWFNNITAAQARHLQPLCEHVRRLGWAAQLAAPDSTASCTTEEWRSSQISQARSLRPCNTEHCRLIACAFEKKVRLHPAEHKLYEKISSSKISMIPWMVTSQARIYGLANVLQTGTRGVRELKVSLSQNREFRT